MRKFRAAEVPRLPAGTACRKPHRQRRSSIESGASSPTSGVYCTIGRRLCRPTGDVDGTQRLEGTCEPRTRTSTENGAFHPHCCTGGIGSIPHGTGPLDRLALPHWCVHGGGLYNKHGTGSRCTLLKQCTYIVRDLGQQPTTWMGTGCCSTGGNQQRSQQCAEQVLQPGNKTARWRAHTGKESQSGLS